MKALDDCFLHDKDRMRHDDALALLRERVPAVAGVETVALRDALGRIAAKDVVAPRAVPLHTNAAVDGYAFAHPAHDGSIAVSQTIRAGDIEPAPLAAGSAARIFTGAPMPPGAETVAMQEDCERDGDSVHLPALKRGANCRKAGEDLQPGDDVLAKGQRLRPADIAALASIGLGHVEVHKPLSVTLLSNGDELRGPETTELRPGEVYDANGPMLAALLGRLSCNLATPPVVKDEARAVEAALSAAATGDVIITSGGASRGDEDHMLAALDRLGTRHLWQLAVKPGRPMMFGQIARADGGTCFVFGLPGNPVAAMVCFLLYVRPTLLRLAGADWPTPMRFQVPAAFGVANKKPDRREFARGILVQKDGRTVVERYGRDGSGLISSLRDADGLIELPEHVTTLAKGDLVDFIPFSSFD